MPNGTLRGVRGRGSYSIFLPTQLYLPFSYISFNNVSVKTYPTIRNIQINNSSGHVNIPGNTTYSLSFSAPGLKNYDYVESAYLYLIIHSYSSDPISKLCITLLGRDEICRSYFDEENNNYVLKVDITLLLRFGIHYAEQSLSITNTDSYNITISCDLSYA